MKSTPSTSQVPCLQKFPGQSAHPIPVPGAGFGVPFFVPRVCCMNPEMSACLLPRWLGDTPVAPLSWPCVAVSIWDTCSVSWTPWPLVSLSIPTLLRRPCGCRKKLGLGIKLNPAQIPSSAILTSWGDLRQVTSPLPASVSLPVEGAWSLLSHGSLCEFSEGIHVRRHRIASLGSTWVYLTLPVFSNFWIPTIQKGQEVRSSLQDERVLELPDGGVGSTAMGVDSVPLNCTVKHT